MSFWLIYSVFECQNDRFRGYRAYFGENECLWVKRLRQGVRQMNPGLQAEKEGGSYRWNF